MVLSHLWPQPLDLQPLFGFVSAAEGFFLISGATTGIVFGRRAESGGLLGGYGRIHRFRQRRFHAGSLHAARACQP